MEHLPKQIPQDNHLSDKQELFRLRVYGVGIREEDKPQEGKGEDIHGHSPLLGFNHKPCRDTADKNRAIS